MSTELKIKSKSLAAEARIIRAEEIKVRNHARARSLVQRPVSHLMGTRLSLYEHRTGIVRVEARATFLARAYLKGMSRVQVEQNPVTDAQTIKRVKAMVTKYGPRPFNEEALTNWLQS